MGCGNAREKLENEMIMMKLQRIGIQMERQNQVKLLEGIDGRKIKVPNIPDYIDSKFIVKSLSRNNSESNKKFKRRSSGKRKLGRKKRSKSVHIRKKLKSQETNISGLETKKLLRPKKRTAKF